MTGAAQHESQLQEDAGKLAIVGSAGGQAKASCKRLQEDAGKLAVGSAGGHVKAMFEATSFYRQFRNQRLAVWAASHGPDPCFSAMVVEPCEGVP